MITKWVSDHRSRVSVWNPLLELDDASLPLDSSIQDFEKEKASYVVDALLQPLLLSQDMAYLRTLKKHKVFLTLKRDLAMVSKGKDAAPAKTPETSTQPAVKDDPPPSKTN
nr:hypothetical protein CFP56_41830 [Quercus suber]